jgi:hypothetical protein
VQKKFEMENLNAEQFAHLNPDTECAAFEQVCMKYHSPFYPWTAL